MQRRVWHDPHPGMTAHRAHMGGRPCITSMRQAMACREAVVVEHRRSQLVKGPSSHLHQMGVKLVSNWCQIGGSKRNTSSPPILVGNPSRCTHASYARPRLSMLLDRTPWALDKTRGKVSPMVSTCQLCTPGQPCVPYAWGGIGHAWGMRGGLGHA